MLLILDLYEDWDDDDDDDDDDEQTNWGPFSSGNSTDDFEENDSEEDNEQDIDDWGLDDDVPSMDSYKRADTLDFSQKMEKEVPDEIFEVVDEEDTQDFEEMEDDWEDLENVNYSDDSLMESIDSNKTPLPHLQMSPQQTNVQQTQQQMTPKQMQDLLKKIAANGKVAQVLHPPSSSAMGDDDDDDDIDPFAL